MLRRGDVAGKALLRAFADRGYEAELSSATTLRIALPDGYRLESDISAWRRAADSRTGHDLHRIAADFVDQTTLVMDRRAARATDGITASPHLRLRVYPEDALPDEMRRLLLSRPLAPGLVETVVMDYPDSLVPVNRSELGGADENAVFAAAIALSVGAEEHYTQRQEIQGVPFLAIGGTHRYVGAHIHVLRRYVDPATAPYGALACFPLPECVFVHEIGGDVHLFAAIETLQDVARRFFDDGDHAISPQLYWWRPGRYEQLPESDAINEGQVPDLRPVGVAFDHQAKTIDYLSAGTNELVELWSRDHPGGP